MTTRPYTAPDRRLAFVGKAVAVGRAFAAIDQRFPRDRYPKQNARWTDKVNAIKNDDRYSCEEQTDKLLSLIGRIKR